MSKPITIQATAGHRIPATFREVEEPTGLAVLSHGIFVNRSENGRFERLAERLASKGVASIRMDLAGHGASEVPSKRASVACMASEMMDVIDWAMQHNHPVSLVASSFSGALASLVLSARGYAVNLHKLVLVNPVLDFVNVFVEAEMQEMADMFSDEAVRAAFKDGSFHPVPHFEMSRHMLVEMNSLDVAECYQHVGMPHLVVHGTADELVSYSRASELVAGNRAAKFVAIEGGVHAFTQSGHEEEVMALVCDYVTG